MKRRPPGKTQECDKSALTPQEALFVLKVIAVDNLTEAYIQAGDRCTKAAASASAARLLTKARVRNAIDQARDKRILKADAGADEAMATIPRAVRLDPRLLLDKTGARLPMRDWPDEIALAVKSVDPDTGKVVFYDTLRAAELIAEAGGRIRKRVDISLTFDHVKHLADHSRDK